MSGIQPHSMPVRPGPWIIFATTAYPEDYVRDTFSMEGVKFKQLKGRFEGADEVSWIVHATDFDRIQYLAEGETCVLYLLDALPGDAAARGCWQLNLFSGKLHWLGFFQETGQEYAEKQIGYTFDPTQWRWWTIEPAPPVPYIEKQKAINLGPLLSREELARLNG